MSSLLLFHSDHQPIDFGSFKKIVQDDHRFQDVRFEEPGGAALECVFVDGGDRTTVRLSGNLKRISFSNDSDAAMRAILLLRESFSQSLRLVDMNYDFDLALNDFSDVDQLRSAVLKAYKDSDD